MSTLKEKLLKKYLGASDQSVASDFCAPKKKKKSRADVNFNGSQGLYITDQNLFQSIYDEVQETNEKIVKVGEDENRKNWVVLESINATEGDPSPPRRLGDGDLSPPRRLRSDDLSPPRRLRNDDLSSPRRPRDGDLSPPRRLRNDNLSPPRRLRGDNLSPPRRPRDDDLSPPRRLRNDDLSPPRRLRNDNLSPPRRLRDDDLSPPRRLRDGDLSPPRRLRSDDLSPPRRSRGDNLSPPRRLRGDNLSPPRRLRNDNLSPPRRLRKDEFSPPRRLRNDNLSPPKRSRLLEKECYESSKRSISRPESHLDGGVEGDRAIGMAGSLVEDKVLRDNSETEKMYAIPNINDEGINEKWKNKMLLDDPLLKMQDMEEEEMNYDKKLLQSKIPKSQRTYQGWNPPNRFGILASYKWDGVDRSNGYENKYFQKQGEKKYEQIQEYQRAIYE